MKKLCSLMLVVGLSFGTSACIKLIDAAGGPVSRSDVVETPCVKASGSGGCHASGSSPSS
jgi:hypothetical protein